MPGERRARARRARGSRVPRIAGTGVVLLLAGTGVVASLVTGSQHVTARHVVLPTRVLSAHEVGLANAGPSGPSGPSGQAAVPYRTLLKSRSGLAFAAVRQVAPEWTADQMAGGNYIFIYIADGTCLSSLARRGRGRAAAGQAVTMRCHLGYAQRWRRQQGGTQGYWQLRNLADGRCLALGGADPAAGQGSFSAQLAPCGAQRDWRQQITFSPMF
jgi:hypothetical protein